MSDPASQARIFGIAINVKSRSRIHIIDLERCDPRTVGRPIEVAQLQDAICAGWQSTKLDVQPHVGWDRLPSNGKGGSRKNNY